MRFALFMICWKWHITNLSQFEYFIKSKGRISKWWTIHKAKYKKYVIAYCETNKRDFEKQKLKKLRKEKKRNGN